MINLPKKLADSGKLVCVFFDEFQEITALNGYDFQKELRAAIQHHDNVSYIFSGSKYHMFKNIFENKNNPLYHSGKTMSLKAIEEKYYTQFILKQMRKIHSKFDEQAASSIYKIAASIPYYIQMLAHETFNLALLNKDEVAMELVAAADENIITNKNDEFLILYENLNLSSKITLDSIISNNGRELFRKDLLEEYPIAASTVKKALNILIEKEIIYKTGPEYTFQDVFFKRWLTKRL